MKRNIILFGMVISTLSMVLISINPVVGFVTSNNEIDDNIQIIEKEQFKNNEEKLTTESGRSWFGLVMVTYNDTTSNGLTNENYKGYLHNIDATFSGYTEFYMFHLIFLDKTFSIKTNSNVKITISHFIGAIAHGSDESIEPNNSALAGIGLNIGWEIE
ncbi:MAG: hypothetical protein DRN27_07685 [Thermoplasmata archaeon]|nr:MAG: hypothetical protein DRN27_07685 [Thermoplasmata archaeon]